MPTAAFSLNYPSTFTHQGVTLWIADQLPGSLVEAANGLLSLCLLPFY